MHTVIIDHVHFKRCLHRFKDEHHCFGFLQLVEKKGLDLTKHSKTLFSFLLASIMIILRVMFE